jgi:hypothetical protein
MSRAITISIGELTAMKIMAEQGLGNIACQDIRESTDIPVPMEIKGIPEGILLRETQFDFAPEIDSKSEGFPQIRYSQRGVMTFIEIVLPNPSANDDVRQPIVSEQILAPKPIEPEVGKESSTGDSLNSDFLGYEIPELLEFRLEPGLRDAIKALESGKEDFSLKGLEDFAIPKALPGPEEDFKMNDIMNMLRRKKKEREKVRVKVKSN